MAININLSSDGIGVKILSDYVLDDVVVSQTGRHHRKTFASKQRLEFTVNLFAQSSDNADLDKWRQFLSNDVSYDSKTWIVEGSEIVTLNNVNDKSGDALKRLVFTVVEKGG